MMQKKPTNELNDLLENMKPDQLDSYFKNNQKYMADEEKGFYYYMTDTLKEKRIKLKDVYSTAGVSESYGGQIIRMEKHTDNRDLIIRFCMAGRFNLNEINRALKLYGLSELYAKEARDACLIVAINNRIFNLFEVDDLLTEKGFKKLSKDIE